MTKIAPQPGIMDIAPYVGGKAGKTGQSNVLKLSSNENPLGPSRNAIDAFKNTASSLNIYPSGDHDGLRSAIAEIYGLDKSKIICGSGSDEILAFLCQTYIGQGDEAVYTEHGFEMYKIGIRANGGTPISVAENNRETDVDNILSACNEKTKLVFVANPNNPTGTMISAGEIGRLADSIPAGSLLILDGAYAEYVEGFDGGAALVDTRDNVVMTRTFSKIFGLGGLRVGWGYCPDHVVDALNRVRGPFNVNNAALAAAEAAVRDQDYIDYCRAENATWRKWLATELSDMGIPSDQSHANFVLARFEDEDCAINADAALNDQGLLVRRVANYNLPHCLRITVGDAEGCKRVANVLREFMGELK